MRLFPFIFGAPAEGSAGSYETANSAEATAPTKTLGQYRVGLDFNPSKNPLVDQLKRSAADAIDYINLGTISPNTAIEVFNSSVASVDDKGDPEISRLKTKSLQQVELCGQIIRESGYSNVNDMAANKELAMTAIEDAAMWGVKAATKEPRG